MSYQEQTTASWGSRLSGAFSGIVLGLVLFLGASGLLWWNEGRTTATRAAVSNAATQLVELENNSQVNPALEGKLVHAVGIATAKTKLSDPVFGFQVDAIRFIRKVEYYQWVEKSESKTVEKMGGGTETVTTYRYEPTWSNKPIDAKAFHDPQYQGKNTVPAHVAALDETAKNVHFGAYLLPDFLVQRISGAQALNVRVKAEQLRLPMGSAIKNKAAMLHSDGGNVVYLGKDPAAPAVGDLRVSFSVVPAEALVSLIAVQRGSTFEPFVAKNGERLSLLSMGNQSSQVMMAGKLAANQAMAWIWRAVGAGLCIAGLAMVLRPLSVLAGVVPFIGGIAAAGTGFTATIVGLFWSALIIALAWMRFRPLFSLSLIALAAAAAGFLYYRKKRQKTLHPAANG
ncbi:MAG: TMEM43 family protein [bacterium]|nr:TMEM43 family protein [bacterium]